MKLASRPVVNPLKIPAARAVRGGRLCRSPQSAPLANRHHNTCMIWTSRRCPRREPPRHPVAYDSAAASLPSIEAASQDLGVSSATVAASAPLASARSGKPDTACRAKGGGIGDSIEAASSSTRGSGGAPGARPSLAAWECRATQSRQACPDEAHEPSSGRA